MGFGILLMVGFPGDLPTETPADHDFVDYRLPALQLQRYLGSMSPPENSQFAADPSLCELTASFRRAPRFGLTRVETGLESSLGAETPSITDFVKRSGEWFTKRVDGSSGPTFDDADFTGIDELPLRSIASLGDRGFDLMRASAENSALFPPDFRRAIAELIYATDATADAMISLRHSLEGEDPSRLAAFIRGWDRDPQQSLATTPSERELIARIDRAEIASQLLYLTEVTERVLPILRSGVAEPFARQLRPLPHGDGIPSNLVFISETSAGLVLIGGVGTTVLPMKGVALGIDLGGDDHWHDGLSIDSTERDAPGASVMIDLSGMDFYSAIDAGLAAGITAISVSWDVSGNDEYHSSVPAFGTGLLGGAVHVDLAGNDRYRIDGAGVGFGSFGLGILWDEAGNDRYQGNHFAFGCGVSGGTGVLIDRGGDDFYLATHGDHQGIVFGAGVTLRDDLPGGVGLLIDRGGDDVYRAAGWSSGFAYGASVGGLIDRSGDDNYNTGEASLGSSHLGGYAFFHDGQGVDRFLSRSYSQGFSDGGVALFVDEGGIDESLTLKPSRGVSASGGVAIYADR